MSRYLANIITGSRILGSVLLAFIPTRSGPFYALYLLCGLSDIADGMIARKMNSSSPFGARLDTIADLVFTAVSFAKLLPYIQVPGWMWIWAAIIALIKAANAGIGFFQNRKLVSVHSRMNKLTGGLLFLFPLTLGAIEAKYSAGIVCFIAAVAAMQEGYLIGTGRALVMRPKRKTDKE